MSSSTSSLIEHYNNVLGADLHPSTSSNARDYDVEDIIDEDEEILLARRTLTERALVLAKRATEIEELLRHAKAERHTWHRRHGNGEAVAHIERVLKQLKRASRDHRRLLEQRNAQLELYLRKRLNAARWLSSSLASSTSNLASSQLLLRDSNTWLSASVNDYGEYSGNCEIELKEQSPIYARRNFHATHLG